MRRAAVLLLASLPLPLVVALGAPLAVYWPNRDSFGAGPAEVLRPFLIVLVAGVAATWLLLALLPPRPQVALRLALASLAAVALLHTHLLVGQYGVLAGETLRLGARTPTWWTSLAATIAIPILTVVFRRRLVPRVTFLSGLLVLWAALAAAGGLAGGGTKREASDSSNYAADWKRFTEVSSGFNVFHFMADSFQADAFERILEERPDLRGQLAGFTFFADQAGYSNWTTLSFPVMWSGREYFSEPFDPASSMPRVMALLDQAHIRELHTRGYRVNLMPPARFFCFDGITPCLTIYDAISENNRRAPAKVRFMGVSARLSPDSVFLADVALFRLLPVPLKPWAYQEGRWRIASALRSRDQQLADTLDLLLLERQIPMSLQLFDRYRADLHLGSEQPAYHFVHMFPPHRPFVLDDGCGFVPLTNEERRSQWWEKDPARYQRQARCAWGAIERALARLKELGVYDRSGIIIEADTGLGIVSPPPAAPGGYAPELGYTQGQVAAYANPLLLVKPPNATGDLKTSLAPTDHSNSPPTVRSWTGLPERPSQALGFFEVPETRSRDRSFVLSGPVVEGGGVGPFRSFRIRGPVRDPSSWTQVGLFSAYGQPLSSGAGPDSAPP